MTGPRIDRDSVVSTYMGVGACWPACAGSAAARVTDFQYTEPEPEPERYV